MSRSPSNERAGADPPITPVPPTTVGPLAVFVHMLFGVVGLLVVAIGAAWWWMGDSVRMSPPAPPLLTSAPIGSVAIGGELSMAEVGWIGAELFLALDRVAASAPSLAPQGVAQLSGGPGVADAHVFALHPLGAPTELELEAALDELAIVLDGSVGRPLSNVQHVYHLSPVPSIAPGPSFSGPHADFVITRADLEAIRVQYLPPDGGTVREWRVKLVGGDVRFVAR